MENQNENKYTQLCCWPRTSLGDNTPEAFEEFMLEKFKARVKFETVTLTKPDETGPGGRSDLLFYVHSEDVTSFAIPRLQAGIRWWEDVLGNGNGHLYQDEILEKYKPTWDYNG